MGGCFRRPARLSDLLEALVTEIPELAKEDTRVLGQEVTIKAVKPEANGEFVYEYSGGKKEGVVEVWMRQGEAESVLQYDLKSQRQVL